MKVNMFLPKYMLEFICVNSKCKDTCCAGWDINIDKNTFNKYNNSTGELKKLLCGKFTLNKVDHDFFNEGFMILKEESKCPFLNDNMLCDIHGNVGDENLCITCRNYPRVFNVVDDVYEKSGLPSCEEVCIEAFLNKDKMQFVEIQDDLDENNIEIRRIIDSEAFEGTESLLQYFWHIRIISINIIQNRNFVIEERLNILKYFYNKIEELRVIKDLVGIEEILENFNNEYVEYEVIKGSILNEENEFYNNVKEQKLTKNIRSVRLQKCLDEYICGIMDKGDIAGYLKDNSKYFDELEKYSYVLENYLVNQIFKDLIPFNKGERFNESINVLINSYRIIKAYIVGVALNSNEKIDEKQIIRVIQALSREIEHNNIYKEILEK